MSNFVEEFYKGKRGSNKGIPLGPGLVNITKAINGVQRGMMYGIAAAPKVGKSTFVDYGFVVSPYLYSLKHKADVRWIYYSYEMDRISKEFDFAAFFLYYDFNIVEIKLSPGVTYRGGNTVPLSSAYLRGQLQDDREQTIIVNDDIEALLKKVYKDRIVPLFGEYDVNGKLLKEGLILFREHKENPTGLRKDILDFAKNRGDFVKESFIAKDGNEYSKLVSYKPKNPNEYVIVVFDTIRKIPKERGFTLKENIDKMIEYSVEIRNLCKYIFIPIIHLNRAMSDVSRMKYMGDLLYPSSDDVKDSGNLAEECNYLFTLFDPNDDRYNLDKHFDLELKDKGGNTLYPNLRTVHLVESRHCSFPQHFRVNMEGNIKNFKQFKI